MPRIHAMLMLSLLAALGGCSKHTVDVQPIRIEPIYVTIDVNVKVDRELDEFFDYKQPPQPAPAAPDVQEPAGTQDSAGTTGEVTP